MKSKSRKMKVLINRLVAMRDGRRAPNKPLPTCTLHMWIKACREALVNPWSVDSEHAPKLYI